MRIRSEYPEPKETRKYIQTVDLLSRFISSGHSDEIFVTDMVISFILAGRDMTSAALTWFFGCLVKIRSMRLYPPVPTDSKRANSDDVLPDGTTVKKGKHLRYDGELPSICNGKGKGVVGCKLDGLSARAMVEKDEMAEKRLVLFRTVDQQETFQIVMFMDFDIVLCQK
ncbi:cytochrome P450 94A1-like protein [Tanacetum coccineum]